MQTILLSFVVLVKILLLSSLILHISASHNFTSVVKYHLYNPQLFWMYTKCQQLLERPCSTKLKSKKHSIDILFLESIISLNQSVHPRHAELFIIPVFYSQSSTLNSCGNHSENVEQMYNMLETFGYYKRNSNIRNHFLMSDSWRTGHGHEILFQLYERNLIIGRFENPFMKVSAHLNFINVGYSTRRALSQECPKERMKYSLLFENPRPLQGRPYLASFIGGYDSNRRNAYKYRQKFYNIWSNRKVPSDMYFHFTNSNISKSKRDGFRTLRIFRNSVMTLSLPGDTPTTDRIFTCFETITLIGMLSHAKYYILRSLPFPDFIPWKDIIVWIDTNLFNQNPVFATKYSLYQNNTRTKLRYELMKKYRNDVLYKLNGSRVVNHVLEYARREVTVLTD